MPWHAMADAIAYAMAEACMAIMAADRRNGPIQSYIIQAPNHPKVLGSTSSMYFTHFSRSWGVTAILPPVTNCATVSTEFDCVE